MPRYKKTKEERLRFAASWFRLDTLDQKVHRFGKYRIISVEDTCFGRAEGAPADHFTFIVIDDTERIVHADYHLNIKSKEREFDKVRQQVDESNLFGLSFADLRQVKIESKNGGFVLIAVVDKFEQLNSLREYMSYFVIRRKDSKLFCRDHGFTMIHQDKLDRLTAWMNEQEYATPFWE